MLRISGSASGPLLDTLAGGRPVPRRAAVRRLRDGSRETLDRAVVLWFPGPASYSGEDCAELHLHAGPAVIEGVSAALVELGARPALPGEFTRRAFLNGKMDLIEAEAIADLVAAETASQRRQALRQLEGALGDLYRGWSERLQQLLAWQEALIDFSDEDLPPEVESRVLNDLFALRDEVARHLADDARGERTREGLVFAICGPPNVGKSSLFNVLAGRDAAIVSPNPGTTRDVIEARLDLDGVAVTLVDTAGLRTTGDAIESEGVRRARQQIERADLVLAVGTAAEPPSEADLADRRALRVANKADLEPFGAPSIPQVSARTGHGIAALRERLAEEARTLTQTGGPPPLTRARHRAALRQVAASLNTAYEAEWPELRAEDLRIALRTLGEVTGAVGVEDILDTIFGQFCIGK